MKLASLKGIDTTKVKYFNKETDSILLPIKVREKRQGSES